MSRIVVGLPFDKPRVAGRGGWKKWRPPVRREPELKLRSVRPPGSESPEPDADNTPQPSFEALPLPLLSIRHFFILSAILAITVLLVWGLVRSNHLSVALRYEISALTKEKLDFQEQNRQLKTELAAIGSLGQLEEAARNVLGLITPNQGQIVVIEP